MKPKDEPGRVLALVIHRRTLDAVLIDVDDKPDPALMFEMSHIRETVTRAIEQHRRNEATLTAKAWRRAATIHDRGAPSGRSWRDDDDLWRRFAVLTVELPERRVA